MLDHSYVAYDQGTQQWREVHAVRLGGREADVLRLLGKSLERVKIAERLGVSRRHVDQLCSVIVEKMGCADVEALRAISIQLYHSRSGQ